MHNNTINLRKVGILLIILYININIATATFTLTGSNYFYESNIYINGNFSGDYFKTYAISPPSPPPTYPITPLEISQNNAIIMLYSSSDFNYSDILFEGLSKTWYLTGGNESTTLSIYVYTNANSPTSLYVDNVLISSINADTTGWAWYLYVTSAPHDYKIVLSALPPPTPIPTTPIPTSIPSDNSSWYIVNSIEELTNYLGNYLGNVGNMMYDTAYFAVKPLIDVIYGFTSIINEFIYQMNLMVDSFNGLSTNLLSFITGFYTGLFPTDIIGLILIGIGIVILIRILWLIKGWL